MASEPSQPSPSLPPIPPTSTSPSTPSDPRTSSNSLHALPWRDRPLLIQCWTDEAETLAPCTDQPGSGLVITAANGRRERAYEIARRLRENGYRRPMLLDAARYATKARPARATSGGAEDDPADFDPRWLELQRDLGLSVLTDSGYVHQGDGEGLARILAGAARLGDAIALLPLHPSWLVEPVARRRLLRRINGFRVPVAILLEHVANPFDVPGAVDGLLEVLAGEVPVLLLRSDVSAFGALACGAVAAAVGTSAALRHLHPGRWVCSAPSVFVPSVLSYKRLDQIRPAKERNPDAVLWRCECPTCRGSDLDWILARPKDQWAALAATHSVHELLRLHARWKIGRNPDIDRVSWREQCWHANWQREHAGWKPSPALAYWHRAIDGQPDGPPGE